MSTEKTLEEMALALRVHTATLENLQGQIFDNSYRKGSLLCFRAMVVEKELKAAFEEEKFMKFQEQIEQIDIFIKEIIKSPNIFGNLFQ